MTDATQHDQAQALRAKYAPQLLLLEQYLPPEQRCYDAGLIAARLVTAAAEFVGSPIGFDAPWLSVLFPAEFLAAYYGRAPADPLTDDSLTVLGIDSAIGLVLGSVLQASDGPITPTDLDTAVSQIS